MSSGEQVAARLFRAWLRACCFITLTGSLGAGEPTPSARTASTLQPARTILVPLVSASNETLPLHEHTRDSATQFTVEHHQSGAQFGWSLAVADVNGDRHPDLFIGARGASAYDLNSGAVIGYRGSATGLPQLAFSILSPGSSNANFGTALSRAGDVNGDGLTDLVVGASLFDGTYQNEGAIFVFHGTADRERYGRSRWRAVGGRTGGIFGASVAGVGDVNGDGFDDVLVGAPRSQRELRREGEARCYLGSSTGLVSTAHWRIYGRQSNSLHGFTVAGAGDVNGDGFKDVLVGAPEFRRGNDAVGRVQLFLGSRDGLSATAAWTGEGPVAGCWYGAALAGVGDLNSDGFDDFAIGAPGGTRSDYHGEWAGQVFLHFGSSNGPSAQPGWIAVGERRLDRFGAAIARAGDVNGDGHPDLVIGAPFHQDTQRDEGRAYLFLGTTNGPEREPSWTADGGKAGARLGWALAGGADMNRDGLDDFVVGTPFYTCRKKEEGRVDVFYGSRTHYQKRLVAVTNQATFASATPVSSLSTRTILVIVFPALAAIAGFVLWRRRVWQRQHALATTTATERERARLARDLHDGLGADLARLSLLGQHTASADGSDAGTGPPTSPHVSTTARAMLQTMEEIVWATNPAHDNLEGLVAFLGQYAGRAFAGTGIRSLQDVPLKLPDWPLAASVRQHLFLAVKETLANALKHSQATEIWLRVRFAAPELRLFIEDNGRGLPPELLAQLSAHDLQPPAGCDGLKNLHQRMAELDGRVTLDTPPGGGTRVTFIVRLDPPASSS